jgi:hypothetical protein
MINKDNCVTYVAKSYVQDIPAPQARTALSSQEAIEIGRKDLLANGVDYSDNSGKKNCKFIDVKDVPKEAELGIFSKDIWSKGTYIKTITRRAYRFYLHGIASPKAKMGWPVRYAIDADTGEILEKTSLVIVD